MRLPSVPVRIVAAAALLALGLVGMVVRENLAREQGQEVRLALAGYDPRSLLQGHFVQFNLTHTFADGTKCPPGADGITTRPKGWVALRREGDHHAPTGAAETRAGALRLGEVAVRGQLTCLGVTTTLQIPGRPPETTPMVQSVGLDLGVDRIHLDQAAAEALEAELRRAPGGQPPGYAVLAVGPDGRARVKGVIVGRKRVDLDWF
jgi:hypothetical protein